MAIGFPAYYKERRKLVLTVKETKEKAENALLAMKCQEIGLHPFALDFKTANGIMTSGERIYVNVTEKEIIIRSECLFPTRIFDFGKNKANIQLFWETFDKL